MPSADQTRSLYARTLRENVAIRRFTGPATARVPHDYPCRGRVWGDRPADLVGGTQQYDKRAVVFAPDLVNAGLSLPVTTADKLVHKGKELAISFPDNATRAEGDDLIAYELLVRG